MAHQDASSNSIQTQDAGFPDPAEYINDPRFHQTFTLPTSPSRSQEFKVTYSDYGYRNPDHPERERVLLLCGPLLGSRYLHIAKDTLAKKYCVRIVDVDRPGFGGTTAVPSPGDRVQAWLELVPALLSHLGIRHGVSLAAHSGGAVYALNFLLYLGHLLSPARPYVALCAPWIHPSHSGASLMTLASGLPEGMVGAFDKVAGFFNRNLAPVTGFSGAASDAISGLIPSLQGKSLYIAPGVDAKLAEFEEKLWGPLIAKVYSENTQGLGQDAVLLLKRQGHDDFWGEWRDYDKYVPLLAEKERSLRSGGVKLRVDVFFSESDSMIGTGNGPKWFDHCWREEQRGGGIDYTSCVIPKAEHDTIVSLRFGILERIFREIAGENEVGSEAATPSVSAEQPTHLRGVVA